jgi:hypothetical protein
VIELPQVHAVVPPALVQHQVQGGHGAWGGGKILAVTLHRITILCWEY